MISRPRSGASCCVMKLSARDKTDALRNQRIEKNMIDIIRGKYLRCPAKCRMTDSLQTENFRFRQASSPTGQHRLASALANEKTRPGGQPGGSSDIGRWGGWALAPDMASLGGTSAPPAFVISTAENVQTARHFLRRETSCRVERHRGRDRQLDNVGRRRRQVEVVSAYCEPTASRTIRAAGSTGDG